MPKLLLIADDNEQFSAMVANVASRRGWVCRKYCNGNELLEALNDTEGPALLLLDILMPDLDGIETIGRLKNSAARDKLRVRFVTGGVQTNAVAAKMIASALHLEVGATIYKPVSIAELDFVLADESGIMDQRRDRKI
ncbi:MAG: hypothetical protein CFE33_20765 [Pseudorhodobacter sp. PARRP1]|nr:MAG: hypothetical protein CFE33_20765 [Pseudorhodobacter sp. PARRP1]